jgi:hypothetical protein
MPLDVGPRDNRFGIVAGLGPRPLVQPKLVARGQVRDLDSRQLLRQVVYEDLREDKPAREIRRDVPGRSPEPTLARPCFWRASRTAVRDHWRRTRFTKVAIAAPLTKEPAATQATSPRFGTFDICAMMNSRAVLDHREVRPRLIRLAQRQIVCGSTKEVSSIRPIAASPTPAQACRNAWET